MNRPTDIFENPGGRRGIRTPGTRNSYGSLANCWFQPLTLSFQSSLPNRQALSLKCGCKVSHLFSSRQIYRNLFSKNLSLCSFLLIDFAFSVLFSSKSHHPPLSSQDHEATQTSSAARDCRSAHFCFITRLQNFLPEETHFLFSEQAQREADEDEREGRLPE